MLYFPEILSLSSQDNVVPAGILHIGQLKGRVLPVAAAKFLDSIITKLGARYGDDIDQ